MAITQTLPTVSIKAVQQLNFLSSMPAFSFSGKLESGDNYRVGDMIKYVPASQSWTRVLDADTLTVSDVVGIISVIKNVQGDVFNTADENGNNLTTDWYFAEIFASFADEMINCNSVWVNDAGTRVNLDPALHTGIVASPKVQWVPNMDINNNIVNYIKLK